MVRMLTESGEVSSSRLAYYDNPDGVKTVGEKCHMCENTVCMRTVTNMATMRNFETVCEKLVHTNPYFQVITHSIKITIWHFKVGL